MLSKHERCLQTDPKHCRCCYLTHLLLICPPNDIDNNLQLFHHLPHPQFLPVRLKWQVWKCRRQHIKPGSKQRGAADSAAAAADSFQRLGFNFCCSSASAASHSATRLCLLLWRGGGHGSSTGKILERKLETYFHADV